MSYLKIQNLYRSTEILELFKDVYAMEKLDGTSSHVKWQISENHPEGNLTFFSGGATHENFVALFNKEELTEKFKAFAPLSPIKTITIYGEAYGGKIQKMAATYGPNLRFTAFEVNIDDNWLDVPKAEKVATDLGFEFVHFVRGPATLEFLNEQRDADSTQAIRIGTGPGHKREGIIIRPIIELTKNNGERLIAKHKRDDFRETRTPRDVGEALIVLTQAKEIASEWVTEQRLDHVLNKLSSQGVNVHTMTTTGQVVKAMVEDVRIEGEGEMVWNNDVAKAIGTEAARLYKKHVTHVHG